jgi:hypothetical protein
MNKRVWVVMSIFLSIILINTVYSKCALVKWEIVGSVISEATKTPIEGAKVFVFFDDSEFTNSNGYYTGYPDFFVTQGDGNFHAISYIDSFERRGILGIGPDICSRTPKNLELIVVKEGFLTVRRKFNIAEYKTKETDEMRKIKLPDILLREPIKK